MRLITGAVLPVFNNPLKLAGQIGMVDAISKGRLEVRGGHTVRARHTVRRRHTARGATQ
jgi:alkanesulfonate monooxygenase SsuD/methylene tetrahydromethanopterin reductase-like flavin-dependent oxidoreductase (luciferase family)